MEGRSPANGQHVYMLLVKLVGLRLQPGRWKLFLESVCPVVEQLRVTAQDVIYTSTADWPYAYIAYAAYIAFTLACQVYVVAPA